MPRKARPVRKPQWRPLPYGIENPNELRVPVISLLKRVGGTEYETLGLMLYGEPKEDGEVETAYFVCDVLHAEDFIEKLQTAIRDLKRERRRSRRQKR